MINSSRPCAGLNIDTSTTHACNKKHVFFSFFFNCSWALAISLGLTSWLWLGQLQRKVFLKLNCSWFTLLFRVIVLQLHTFSSELSLLHSYSDIILLDILINLEIHLAFSDRKWQSPRAKRAATVHICLTVGRQNIPWSIKKNIFKVWHTLFLAPGNCTGSYRWSVCIKHTLKIVSLNIWTNTSIPWPHPINWICSSSFHFLIRCNIWKVEDLTLSFIL